MTQVLLFLLCAGGPETVVGPVPGPVREHLGLSVFYTRYIAAGGLPIVSTGKVADGGLLEARTIVLAMLQGREDLLAKIARNKVRLAVMAPDEQTTDVPEHSDLKPKEYWDRRARGLGATRHRPAVSVGEENLLGLPGDRYPGESILIHEFAHTIHLMGLRDLEKDFDNRLNAAHTEAKRLELWKGTYADSNDEEYWAEGVQSYFNANSPKDGKQHNGIDTRNKLRAFDPVLFSLIDGVFRQNPWTWPGRPKRKD